MAVYQYALQEDEEAEAVLEHAREEEAAAEAAALKEDDPGLLAQRQWRWRSPSPQQLSRCTVTVSRIFHMSHGVKSVSVQRPNRISNIRAKGRSGQQ